MKRLFVLTLSAGVIAISACSSASPVEPTPFRIPVAETDSTAAFDDSCASHSGWIVASGAEETCEPPAP